MQGSAASGTIALAIGILLVVLTTATADGGADPAGAAIRDVIGAALSLVGLGLLLCAVTIGGVGWYMQRVPRR